MLVSGSADATVRVWDVLAQPATDEPANRRHGSALGTHMSFAAIKEQARRVSQGLNGANGADGDGATSDRQVGKLGAFGDKDKKET